MAGFNITVAGDSAINLEFGNVISKDERHHPRRRANARSRPN